MCCAQNCFDYCSFNSFSFHAYDRLDRIPRWFPEINFWDHLKCSAESFAGWIPFFPPSAQNSHKNNTQFNNFVFHDHIIYVYVKYSASDSTLSTYTVVCCGNCNEWMNEWMKEWICLQCFDTYWVSIRKGVIIIIILITWTVNYRCSNL